VAKKLHVLLRHRPRSIGRFRGGVQGGLQPDQKREEGGCLAKLATSARCGS
jgi:hypothetical protein